MAEYIGSRISLISKRDIRYVGTLHEISSENSTVALEQVRSYGTEGRSEEEVPASDNVYEYIVFRGSDVKDLRIEKEPEKKPVQQPQVPDDPAILGNARPIGPPQTARHPPQQSPPPSGSSQQPAFPTQGRGQPPRYSQQSPFPYGGYPPPANQRFGTYSGPQGFPPQNYPGMQYGPPLGWYGPPGQGFPHGPPGPMYPPHLQQGFPGQPPNQRGPPAKPETPAESAVDNGPVAPQQTAPIEKPAATVRLPTLTPPSAPAAQSAPTPPTESKPNVAAALAPPLPVTAKETTASGTAPVPPRSGRIQPAVPMVSPAMKTKATINGATKPPIAAAAPSDTTPAVTKSIAPRPTQPPTHSSEDASRDARAAVAAAMAKKPAASTQPNKQPTSDSAMDNLTKKVNEMRTNENARSSRQPGTGGYAAGNRGIRGGYRGGRPRTASQTKPVDVPKTDYDFESANAKFNKQDLVKEAIASGDPIGSPVTGSSEDSISNTNGDASPTGYDKTSSFFDNISSEAKDREDVGAKRLGGREFRSEEQKKNFDTFGQGSVDSFRGGYRGRGRGRGFRGGRGGFNRGGRGGVRGRGGAVVAEG